MDYDSNTPVLGYRRWKAEPPVMVRGEHLLIGSHQSTVWPPGEIMYAECKSYKRWNACKDGPIIQNNLCKCGLHLWYSLSDAMEYTFTNGTIGHVIGICRGGGKILFDNKYARCSEAEILCLIKPEEYPQYERWRGELQEKTYKVHQYAEAAAKKYEVPLLSHADAMDYVWEEGRFVGGLIDTEHGVWIRGVDD